MSNCVGGKSGVAFCQMKNLIWIPLCVLLACAAAFVVVRTTQSTSTTRPAEQWEYAELRFIWSRVESRSFLIISCPEIGLSFSSEPKTSQDAQRSIADAVAKMPGSGKTIQDRMGSMGWELVSTSKVKEPSDAISSEENTIYYFKRKR
jgi:hypothetical protein